MKIIYDEKTQELLDTLKGMLEFTSKSFESNYTGRPCDRFLAFHEDPSRKQILNEMSRLMAISMPVGYEYDGKALAQQL